jgi:hypothetical protein
VKATVNGGESRRDFLKGVAMTGAVSVISAASAAGQNNGPGGQSTPIVPNAPGEKSGTAEFQAPQRAMGKTGLQVSILGVGGYHLGAVAGQPEVNDMIAKALDQLLRQRLGILQGSKRGAPGYRAQGEAGEGDRDDQGLHPWPEERHRYANAGGVADAPADRPP